MLLLCILILIIYVVLIGSLSYGFDKIEPFNLQNLEPQTKFTVVIPFRNEAKNLSELLTSITNLNYPSSHFEVILVNDESSDDSHDLINIFLQKQQNIQAENIFVIQNKRSSNSPKKDAITTAITEAKYSWIITTDADCKLPEYWLDSFNEFIQTHDAVAIAGLVLFTGQSSFFTRFQILDTLSLQGATIGGFGIKQPFMCNGANFAYRKDAFLQVKGFTGNDNLASGDDIFLLEKIKIKYPKNIHFLKSQHAIVKTKVANSVSEYIQQRLRWASKSKQYKFIFSKLLGVIVFLSNLVILALIPLLVLESFSFKTAGLLFLLKFSIDVLLIFKAARFFKSEHLLLSYLFASVIYPIIMVYIVFSLPLSKLNWKGRRYNT